jgi:hypothetical protein
MTGLSSRHNLTSPEGYTPHNEGEEHGSPVRKSDRARTGRVQRLEKDDGSETERSKTD